MDLVADMIQAGTALLTRRSAIPLRPNDPSGWRTVAFEDPKMILLNKASTTMLYQPRFYQSADDARAVILANAELVAQEQPEFLLQLAVYVRAELNVRSTACFLLAAAATFPSCRPFLRAYAHDILLIPTDMLEVASLYQVLASDQATIDTTSPTLRRAPILLPACLKKAFSDAFARFDAYQLAKHNHTAADTKRRRKQAAAAAAGVELPPASDDNLQNSRPRITLKQLVRCCHISQPKLHVLAVLGARYPADAAAFAASGLPGAFQAEHAGRRIRLPVPATWETAVSAQGNTSATWSELIRSRRLPYMAALRNLRNIVLAGVDAQDHLAVMQYLGSETAVARSRQLPFAFLSAFNAIAELDAILAAEADAAVPGADEPVAAGSEPPRKRVRRAVRSRRTGSGHAGNWQSTGRSLVDPLLQQYRDTLDRALKLAAVRNMAPLPGRVTVFCDVSGSMMYCRAGTARGTGSMVHPYEISLLLGLLIAYNSEQCDLRLMSSPGPESRGSGHVAATFDPEASLFDNMMQLQRQTCKLGGGNVFPYDYFTDAAANNTHVDTVVMLTDVMVDAVHQAGRARTTPARALAKYRAAVNPAMRFVLVDLYGAGASLVSLEHDNDDARNVSIAGFSDQVLTYLARSADPNAQLNHVCSLSPSV